MFAGHPGTLRALNSVALLSLAARFVTAALLEGFIDVKVIEAAGGDVHQGGYLSRAYELFSAKFLFSRSDR